MSVELIVGAIIGFIAANLFYIALAFLIKRKWRVAVFEGVNVG